MNAYELAQELEWLQDEYYYIKESADMLRKQAEKISNMEAWENKYLDRIEALETVLRSIANEPIELSHDKIKWQCQDHIRWAKEILK